MRSERTDHTAAMVTNPGSRFEESTDVTAKAGPGLQENLKKLQADLAK